MVDNVYLQMFICVGFCYNSAALNVRYVCNLANGLLISKFDMID
jgi:hypothetical protein